MKLSQVVICVGLMLCIAFGWIGRAYFYPQIPPEIPISVDSSLADSLRLEVKRLRDRKPIVIKQVISRIDTVYRDQQIIADQDVLILDHDDFNTIAAVDTMFKDYGKLDAVYWFPPLNYFDFTFTPVEPKVIVKFVPTKPKWWEKKEVAFIGGVLTASVIVYLVK